jgi:hypothetical protein
VIAPAVRISGVPVQWLIDPGRAPSPAARPGRAPSPAAPPPRPRPLPGRAPSPADPVQADPAQAPAAIAGQLTAESP